MKITIENFAGNYRLKLTEKNYKEWILRSSSRSAAINTAEKWAEKLGCEIKEDW